MILLDTHIFVGVALGTESKHANDYMGDDLLVSAISASEIACLVRLSRLALDTAADVWFEEAAKRMGARVDSLSGGMLARAMSLAWSHRDPADRILAQTLRETPGAKLYTRDRTLLSYCKKHRLPAKSCR